MKRFLSYILIVLVFVQLLAPFTIGGGIKNNLEIRTSKAEAAEDLIFGITNVTHTDKTVAATIGHNASSDFKQQMEDSYDGLFLRVQIKDASGNDASPEHRFTLDLKYLYSPTNFEELTPETPYKVIATMEGEKSGIITTLATDEKDFTTNESGNTDSNNEGASDSLRMNDESILPTCTLFSAQTWGGCIGRLLYWGVFKPTSYIFALTGRLLDISVNYSVKDTSYRSDFVVEGWGVVRDFCNMFFIFILLYIAFGTILNLHSVKTKEMIINVVIIGLLINFSLFATQVIVDASNILTRVFYNSQTIKIGPVDDNNIIQNQVGSQGEIQLSLALVGKINPQRLILNAGKADDISVREDISEDTNVNNNGVSATTFILVTILASIVNIVGIIVFLTCSLIFISRVIGLWIAMIFAPLAFFSYTIPAMQNWEMVGWKRWWPETIKLAFMAPAFVFFMYLIIKFLETGLGLLINDSKGGLDFVLGIFVPFIFVMILLTKAKDIAKNMSGKIGQSITDGLSKVGGVALGAGLGGLAMAGRQTIGRLATNAAQSNAFRDWAGKSKIGASALRMTSGVASKNFDFRATKLGGMAGKELGVDLGKAKKGGFAEIREEKIHKEEEFAKKLLDTSAYGMAKLRSGDISNKKATEIIEQMKKAGGSNADFVKDLNPSTLRAKLVGNKPEDIKIAQAVADQMSSIRRNERARNLSQGINRRFVTNMIAANKIRKDPAALAKARDATNAFKQLSAELKKSEGSEHKKEEEHKTETHTVQATPTQETHTPSGDDHGADHHA